MEVASNGSIVFVAGVISEPSPAGPVQKIVLYALSFDASLRVIDRLVLPDQGIGSPVMMKRFPGYDIFAVGFYKLIVIAGFEAGKLKRYARIEDVHTDYISDFVVKKDTLYSKGIKENKVKVLKFGQMNISAFQASTFPATTNQAQPLNQTPSTLTTSTIVPSKYQQHKLNRIEFGISGILEKVSLSKTGKLIYAGGSSGMNLLKFDDQSQKYLQVKNNVNFCYLDSPSNQSLWSEELEQRPLVGAGTSDKRPGDLLIHRKRGLAALGRSEVRLLYVIA